MARKRERAFAAFGAVLFLITSSALTIAVVVSLMGQHKSSNNNTSNNAQNTSVKQNKTTKQLAGTKMENFTPITTPLTQLQTQDLVVGTGPAVQPGATVTVDYTGAVASTGIIFQSSLDTGQPVTFGLNGVIKGWTQGIPGMKVGGTRRLLIPADLAYGQNPPPGSNIPPNADLVFDVTVHKAS